MRADSSDFDLKERLVDKSFDAYVLALETINRITVRYRMEAFCYLICNAWELLLKAKILDTTGQKNDIYYSEGKDQVKRSLSLRACLQKVFPNEKDPIRRNLERVQELRDKAVHLVIGQIPPDLIGLFQACVVNYHKQSHDWFGMSLSKREPVGMMSIVYDVSPEMMSFSGNRLRSELGPDSFEFLTQYCAEVRREFDNLHQAAEFAIKIDFHALITKSADSADIQLISGQIDEPPTRIIEVPKDPSTSHPFRQKDLIQHVKDQVPNIDINTFDVKCLNDVYGIKGRPDYFYQGRVPNSPAQYSKTCADWIIRQCMDDGQFLYKTREKEKELRESRKFQSN